MKEFRVAIGKTQEEMAKNLGITKSYYEKIENNSRNISSALMKKIKKKYPLIDINIFLAQ